MPQKKEAKFQGFFTSRLFLIILLVLFFLVLFAYGRSYYREYKIRQEINSLRLEVKNLENKKIESLEILKYVTSDKFVEEKAREELNMKKPGENVLVINNLQEHNDKDVEHVDKEVLNNPIKWWYYFIHKDI